MKNHKIYSSLILVVILFLANKSFSQTSWTGTTSTAWSTAANWTNGVPTSSVDAIIGDANFTGPNQPAISASSVCKSLTLGGTVAATISVDKGLTVSGNITINANGTMLHGRSTITLTGNWSNAGSYTGSTNKTTVVFAGIAQTLGGNSTTSFRKITINASSTVTLTQNIIVDGTGNSNILTVNGTLNPNESPSFQVSGAGKLTVGTSAVLKVNAATFAGNYASTGVLYDQTIQLVNYYASKEYPEKLRRIRSCLS